LRLFSFGGYGLALAALALVVFGAYESYPLDRNHFIIFNDRISARVSKTIALRWLMHVRPPATTNQNYYLNIKLKTAMEMNFELIPSLSCKKT